MIKLYEEEGKIVEIRDVFSLQLKEIHIHVIFTFWKKSLVAEENFFSADT